MKRTSYVGERIEQERIILYLLRSLPPPGEYPCFDDVADICVGDAEVIEKYRSLSVITCFFSEPSAFLSPGHLIQP